VHLSDERAIVILLVGATAGLPLSKLVRGTGRGMTGDGAVGIVGAFVSDWLLLRFHFHFGGGVIGLIVRAAIGATVVVLVLRVSGARQKIWRTRSCAADKAKCGTSILADFRWPAL
jgi:uncharacterized membrane protein YeaQ/YmgE (transglycosylase-associated protein family)